MKSFPDGEALQNRISRLRSGVDRSVGALEALEAREAALVASIAAAKRRAQAKPQVDKFLQQLQVDTHRRTIGGYERMLSALSQDVLGQNVGIQLDLGTERGLPALDINAEHRGAVASVMDGCGGSLNNVVSFGLRAIALRKSGLRFFMALDEADCWLKPGRVELFYSVMKALAVEARMQALVITHHPVDTFEDGVTVIRLDGSEEKGVTGATHMRAMDWPDEEMEGIRSIRLHNFSSVGDVTLRLGPGLTALTGENNIGKSRFMRALRVVFYGESEDADIRHGQRWARVEIGLERGRMLSWRRDPAQSPVTSWKLVDREGKVVVSEGVECSGGGGRTVPEWVRRECRLGRVEDLDLQLPRQTTPIFLLADSPSKRAQVLSVGRESGHLRSMIEQHRKDSGTDSSLASRGETELVTLREKIARLRGLVALGARVGGLQETLGQATRSWDDAEAAADVLRRLEEGAVGLARAERIGAALARLPAASLLDEGQASLGSAVDSAAAIGRIESAGAALRRAAAVQRALSRLPRMPDPPQQVAPIVAAGLRIRTTEKAWLGVQKVQAVLERLPRMPDAPPPVTAVGAAVDGLESKARALEEAEAERARIQAEIVNARAALEELIEQQGGACPVCGGALTLDHLSRKAA